MHIDDGPPSVRAITGVATAVTAFLGRAPIGPVNEPVMVESYADFEREFGGLGTYYPLSYCVRDYFLNGGAQAIIVRLVNAAGGAQNDEHLPQETGDGDAAGPLEQAAYEGSRTERRGLYALEKANLFTLLCIPPDTRDGDVPPAVYQTALAYCAERRAMLIVDPPLEWSGNAAPVDAARDGLASLGLTGDTARNAALYFPRVRQSDPLMAGRVDTAVPCGIVAGVIARTDSARGVWSAPSGRDATLRGVQGLAVAINERQSAVLNPLGINCLRNLPPSGPVVWGSRTLRGGDSLADPYKYLPVRRTALFIEESLSRGLTWAMFEPNDEPLWNAIRNSVGDFLHGLFRQGAFQGQTPRDAYLVKCDGETTTQADIDRGIVNVVVGFAPLKPAEFVVIRLQQIAHGGCLDGCE